MKFKRIEKNSFVLRTTEEFIGQSIEEKVFSAVNSKTPIEAVAPMVYTERKEGVLPETNIRTDRFEIAQEAMNNIAKGIREKRLKKMLGESTEQIDKQASGSSLSINEQATNN